MGIGRVDRHFIFLNLARARKAALGKKYVAFYSPPHGTVNVYLHATDGL